MTLGPMVPSRTGSSIDLPVELSVSVIVPPDAATLVLSPSIARSSAAAPAGNCLNAVHNKTASADYQTSPLFFAMQYRNREIRRQRAPPRHRPSGPAPRRGRALP